MKKLFLIIFISVSFKANSQAYEGINFNKIFIRYDTTVVNVIPQTYNNYSWVIFTLKSNNDTLGVAFQNGVFWTKAQVTSSNITLVGSSTITMITLPTTVSPTNRYLMSDEVVYTYTTSDHVINNLFSDNPLKPIIRLSDGKTVGVLFGQGVLWYVVPTTVALIAQSIVSVQLP